MLESASEEVGQGVGRRVTQVLEIARHAAPKMRPGGTLLLTGGSVKKVVRESGISPAAFAVLPPFTAALALELAPVRVNLIQAGFVDTALAASYFADAADLEARRAELRATLPIRRVVGPAGPRRPRRPPHDQHRHHRRGLRHRRRPAVHRLDRPGVTLRYRI
jgi:NAD(P)-dependent dehydrogenase (short-subunit alcohol dehydrogenase family)